MEGAQKEREREREREEKCGENEKQARMEGKKERKKDYREEERSSLSWPALSSLFSRINISRHDNIYDERKAQPRGKSRHP